MVDHYVSVDITYLIVLDFVMFGCLSLYSFITTRFMVNKVIQNSYIWIGAKVTSKKLTNSILSIDTFICYKFSRRSDQ